MIEQLIEATLKAPSAWNLQPWRLAVVTESEKRKELWEAGFRQPQLQAAQATIVVYSDMDAALRRVSEVAHPEWPAEKREKSADKVQQAFEKMSPEERETWGLQQTYIALGYLLLLAEQLGIATSPMLGFRAEAVKQALWLGPQTRIAALVAMGWAAEEGLTAHRLSAQEMVTWI